MNVAEAVRSRRSIRKFKNQPVPLETLRKVLETARWTPSGCNFQPWKATVLTGETLRSMQAKLLGATQQQPIEYDFSAPRKSIEHQARLERVNAAMYGSIGISRDDADARARQSAENLISFGAPVVLLCHFECFMGAPQWADVGMWLQTIMLLLRAEGLDSCAQEWLSLYARLIKEHVGIPDDSEILFCGLAIGYCDAEAQINNFDRERVSLEGTVSFLGF